MCVWIESKINLALTMIFGETKHQYMNMVGILQKLKKNNAMSDHFLYPQKSNHTSNRLINQMSNRWQNRPYCFSRISIVFDNHIYLINSLPRKK